MAYKTIRIDVLRRMIVADKLEAKVAQRLTDDFAWDAATNFGRTDWKPAAIGREDGGEFVSLGDYMFRAGGARCYRDTESQEIHVTFGGTYWTLREKQKEAA